MKKDKKTFLILTITAYVVLAGVMIYKAQQSPGACPFISMCSSSKTTETAKVETAAVSKTKTATAVIVKAKETKKIPTLLELGSESCAPCKMMKPILAKMEKEYDGIIKIKFVDVWLKENTHIGIKYKINSIPVQIFFDAEGKELWRHTGYFSEDEILRKCKESGYDLPALKKVKK
jgi:thioredoxin